MQNDKKSNKPLRFAELSVTEISKKGNGLALLERPSSAPCWAEVPFTWPGDRVRVQLLSKQRRVCQTILDQVIQPAPERIPPLCSHFGSCGGCRFQHIPYSVQLAHKAALVEKMFADLATPETKIFPIFGCADPWHYRNKMEYSFTSDRAGNQYLGMMLQGRSRHAFNLMECPLTADWFVQGVKSVREWWKTSELLAYHPAKNSGSLRTLTMREGRRTGDRLVMLTVSGNPEYALNKQQVEGFVAALRRAIEPPSPEQRLSIFLRIHQIHKGSPTQMYEMHLYGPEYFRETMHIKSSSEGALQQLSFQVSPTAFFQPNTLQAENLYSLALQQTRLHKEMVVYDLYCGTGTLGICLAQEVKQVIGIEISPEAVLDARTNIQLNQRENITLFAGAVHQVLNKQQDLPKPDLVVVDPPRVGLDVETIALLVKLRPRQILYISCNPESQALNAKELLKQGYRLTSIQPIDQFPQTPHIENAIVMECLH